MNFHFASTNLAFGVVGVADTATVTTAATVPRRCTESIQTADVVSVWLLSVVQMCDYPNFAE